MAKIFKKLFSGDTVATYDGKVVKKLTTEEPTESIVGTWVFNNVLDFSIFQEDTKPTYAQQYVFDIQFNSYVDTTFTEVSGSSGFVSGYNECIKIIITSNNATYNSKRLFYVVMGASNELPMCVYKASSAWGNALSKTITITGGADITNETFITWLKASATKQ